MLKTKMFSTSVWSCL